MEKFVQVTQTARYLPARVVTNQELSRFMDTSDEWIRSRTGIEERRVVTNQQTSDLCIEVAKSLLIKANLSADQIDFIIVATMTPDYHSPSTACLVQGAIEAEKAFAFDLSAACSGFVFALSTAEKLLSGSHQYQRALVIGAETLSKSLDWQDRSTAVLFGDGAGGVLLEKTADQPHFLGELLCADGQRAMSLTSEFTANQSPFFEGDQAVNRCLTMDGRKIFDFCLRNVSANLQELLAKQELTSESIDYFLLHQANKRMIETIAKKAKIPIEKFLLNMQTYGNTSAASIPILLDEAVEDGFIRLGSGQKIVLTGYGGGLTWGSLLLSC